MLLYEKGETSPSKIINHSKLSKTPLAFGE